jgi:hypothetical protein
MADGVFNGARQATGFHNQGLSNVVLGASEPFH